MNKSSIQLELELLESEMKSNSFEIMLSLSFHLIFLPENKTIKTN